MFDFRQISLFCLEKHLSKYKWQHVLKLLGEHDPFGPPVYAYEVCDLRMCCIWKLDMWLPLFTCELFYFQFNSSAVELFVSCTTGVSLTNAAMCMNSIVFVKHSDHIVCYFLVIEIVYCAKATALHMPDWKISQGGSWVKLSCCLKKVEPNCLGFTFKV